MTIKNGDIPATPTPIMDNGCTAHGTEPTYGLTKREMFAMHMMAAWIQHHGSASDYGFSPKSAALSAVECADALLVALNE